jgi:hypothetical protein
MVLVNALTQDGSRLKAFVQAAGCRQIHVMDCTTRCGVAIATTFSLTQQSFLLQWQNKRKSTQIDHFIDCFCQLD